MQQDAHEFLNHLLNTCADILLGLSIRVFFSLSDEIYSCYSGEKRRKRQT
jgi:hypothetical protein